VNHRKWASKFFKRQAACASAAAAEGGGGGGDASAVTEAATDAVRAELEAEVNDARAAAERAEALLGALEAKHKLKAVKLQNRAESAEAELDEARDQIEALEAQLKESGAA
jgi:hypothetical protein